MSSLKWYSTKSVKGEIYARAAKTLEFKKYRTFYMHRLIMDATLGVSVDHINHNGLDNRKSNLRLCTHSENMKNRLKPPNKTSQYKGVCWDKAKNKWMAKIRLNGKTINLGRYHSESQAAEVYDDNAARLFGEFAKLNFPV